jgi:hypothetical protein
VPIYVTRTVDRPEGPQFLADRDTLSRLTGYAAITIRLRCSPTCYDETTGRALYDQNAVVADLRGRGIHPRPHQQGRRQTRGAWRVRTRQA